MTTEPLDEAKASAFVQRMTDTINDAFVALMISIGHQTKLFDTIAPRMAERPGGYTRILRVGYRRGDSAEVAQIELIGSEYDPNAKLEKAAPAEASKPKATGVGGRLRAAAQRLRGSKGESTEAGPAEKRTKPAKAPSRRSTGGAAAKKG